MLAALLAVLPVQAAALAGDWRKAVPGEDPEGVRHADSGFAPFDTTRLTSFPRNPDGVWVRLRPVSGAWPEAGEVLVVRGPDFERVTFFPSSDRPYSRSLHDLDPTAEPAGHGRLHFALDPPPADGEALLLRFEPQPVLAAGVTFAIVPRADYLREEARWLAVASACFAIMLAMALVAAFSSLVLRDVSFLYYAGYVLSYAAIQALQCGYAFHPLGFASIAAAPWNWGRILTGLSVLLATLFLDRFASLGRFVPRLRKAVLALGWATFLVAASGYLPGEWPLRITRALINPLLMAGSLVLLFASLRAFLHGGLYAGVFLLGWTPLLLLVLLGSAQTFGVLSDVLWIEDGTMVAGASEALILSLGLAARSQAVRRDRDQARRLAELDPLTAVLNRRAWTEHMQVLLEKQRTIGGPLALLFLDLDHFKSLNDNFGHQAGDGALRVLVRLLRQELPGDSLIGRYGGEEFVIALPRASWQTLMAIAERVRIALEACRVRVDATGAVLTVSIGLAISRSGESIAELVERADRALYQAKSEGRNRVVVAG